MFNNINNATLENSNDPEEISSSKYYDIDEMYNTEIPRYPKSLSLFHKAHGLLIKIWMTFNIF